MNKGHMNQIKSTNKIKILILNLHGFRPSNDSKIHMFKEAYRKY